MKKGVLVIFSILLIIGIVGIVFADNNIEYGPSNFTTHNGAGTYTLSPGDQVTLDNGYFLKYVSYQKDASWQRMQQTVTGDEAYLGLYNGTYDPSNVNQNMAYSFTISDIDTEKIKTFSSGFYFNAEPLNKDSKIASVEIKAGELTTCVDTDAGHVDSSSKTWGLNYLMKGKATEADETNSGRTEQSQTDSCLDSQRLTEWYCFNDKMKSTIYTCPGSCANGECISSNPNPTQATMSITDAGTYTVKQGTKINVNQIATEVAEISWALSGDTVPYIRFNSENAQVCNPHAGENCTYFYGPVMQPYSNNLNIKVNSISVNEDKPIDSTASITVTKLNETYKYPEPLPTVRARTWVINMFDEEMSCNDLCKEYNSSVVTNGCYDKNLKKCTVMNVDTCTNENGNYKVKKDYSTSCCCKGGDFGGCTSTDGVNPFVKGRSIDKDGNVYEDKCDGSTVIDYYCFSSGTQVSNINNVVCPNGCEDGACIKIDVEPTTETEPVDLPNKADPEPEFNSFVCSGCALESKCYPFGFRKDKKFCDDKTSTFIIQNAPNTACENNFECDSNLCVNSSCVSGSLWAKMMRWFGNLFGGK